MDFQLSEEQTLLKDGIDRFVRAEYAMAQRDRHLAEPEGFSRSIYAALAGMGVTGLLVDEAHGGSGRGAVDLMLVMEAFGRGLVVDPVLASNVMAVDLIGRLGNPQQKAALLPGLAAGTAIAVPAVHEAGARYETAWPQTRARRDDDGWRLDGAKALVQHAGAADLLLVTASTGTGTALFAVPAAAPGVKCDPYRLQDGQGAADVSFEDVRLPDTAMLGAPEAVPEAVVRMLELGNAAICAEAVGAMAAMLELTIRYLQTRKQFGAQIGTFQALQHRVADMAVAVEQARSMALYAAMMIDEPDAGERARAISAAKVQICQASRFVGQLAIQLHGGMGVTMEMDVGRYFVRTSMIQLQFGDLAHHLAAVAEADGLFPAAELADVA